MILELFVVLQEKKMFFLFWLDKYCFSQCEVACCEHRKLYYNNIIESMLFIRELLFYQKQLIVYAFMGPALKHSLASYQKVDWTLCNVLNPLTESSDTTFKPYDSLKKSILLSGNFNSERLTSTVTAPLSSLRYEQFKLTTQRRRFYTSLGSMRALKSSKLE